MFGPRTFWSAKGEAFSFLEMMHWVRSPALTLLVRSQALTLLVRSPALTLLVRSRALTLLVRRSSAIVTVQGNFNSMPFCDHSDLNLVPCCLQTMAGTSVVNHFKSEKKWCIYFFVALFLLRNVGMFWCWLKFRSTVVVFLWLTVWLVWLVHLYNRCKIATEIHMRLWFKLSYTATQRCSSVILIKTGPPNCHSHPYFSCCNSLLPSSFSAWEWDVAGCLCYWWGILQVIGWWRRLLVCLAPYLVDPCHTCLTCLLCLTALWARRLMQGQFVGSEDCSFSVCVGWLQDFDLFLLSKSPRFCCLHSCLLTKWCSAVFMQEMEIYAVQWVCYCSCY